MTTRAQLRKAALAGEGAQEERGDAGPVWSVGGRVFARVLPEGEAWLALDDEAATRMAGELRPVRVVEGGVRLPLGEVSGMAVNYWTHQAWRTQAPAEGVRQTDAAAAAASRADDDFGPIGAPARRALHGAGIGSLDELAGRDRDEVAALHGIGPKVLERLAQQLSERGQDW